MVNDIEKIFFDFFKYTPTDMHLFFAPGRVNLIGEHTDYTGGLVFPFGIDAGTYIALSYNNSNIIRLGSHNFEKNISDIHPEATQIKTGHWTDYFKGVLTILKDKGYNIKSGFDGVVYGNIPDGAGLSSSASFEMVSIVALLGTNEYKIPEPGTAAMVELALIAQKAENSFVGLNCGIMDQFASANSKVDRAIKLDCSDLSYEYAKLELNNYEVLVTNTNKKRRLEESKYNERRAECEKGFQVLKSFGLNCDFLGKISIDTYNQVRNRIKDKTIQKRLDHVITENDRVKEAYKALNNNNLKLFASLINQSGESLRNNYEVTGTHLDAIVDAALNTPGVIASRMTGAGFGGCAVNIIERNKKDEIIKSISDKYKAATGIKADFYSFKPGNGTAKIKIT